MLIPIYVKANVQNLKNAFPLDAFIYLFILTEACVMILWL